MTPIMNYRFPITFPLNSSCTQRFGLLFAFCIFPDLKVPRENKTANHHFLFWRIGIGTIIILCHNNSSICLLFHLLSTVLVWIWHNMRPHADRSQHSTSQHLLFWYRLTFIYGKTHSIANAAIKSNTRASICIDYFSSRVENNSIRMPPTVSWFDLVRWRLLHRDFDRLGELRTILNARPFCLKHLTKLGYKINLTEMIVFESHDEEEEVGLETQPAVPMDNENEEN